MTETMKLPSFKETKIIAHNVRECGNDERGALVLWLSLAMLVATEEEPEKVDEEPAGGCSHRLSSAFGDCMDCGQPAPVGGWPQFKEPTSLYVCPNCQQSARPHEHEHPDSCMVNGLKWTCNPAQPEPTPVAEMMPCPHCNQMGDHYDQRGYYNCEPAPINDEPAPSDTKAETVCPNCDGDPKVGEHYIGWKLGGFTCQRPEPAPVAASQMPLPILNAADGLLQEARAFDRDGMLGTAEFCRRAADALESWWREHVKQPVVGMSPELEIVLHTAATYVENRQRLIGGLQGDEVIYKAISAVRAQFAQVKPTHAAPKVELAKVRELIEDMAFVLTDKPHKPISAWSSAIKAALTEIDAAEGKVGE